MPCCMECRQTLSGDAGLMTDHSIHVFGPQYGLQLAGLHCRAGDCGSPWENHLACGKTNLPVGKPTQAWRGHPLAPAVGCLCDCSFPATSARFPVSASPASASLPDPAAKSSIFNVFKIQELELDSSVIEGQKDFHVDSGKASEGVKPSCVRLLKPSAPVKSWKACTASVASVARFLREMLCSGSHVWDLQDILRLWRRLQSCQALLVTTYTLLALCISIPEHHQQHAVPSFPLRPGNEISRSSPTLRPTTPTSALPWQSPNLDGFQLFHPACFC